MIEKDVIELYNQIDWAKLLRKDLGEYSLEEAKPHFDIIKNIFDDILGYPDIEILSTNFITIISNQVRSFYDFTNQIIDGFQDTAQRKNLLNHIKDKEYEIFQNLSPIYNYLNSFDQSEDTKISETIKKAQEKIDKLNNKLEKTDNLLLEAQKIVTGVKAIQYGNFFGSEASKNDKTSKFYIWMMIGSIVLTGIVSIFFLQDVEFVKNDNATFWKNLFNTINTQNILIRFVVLSLGVYLISHFSKVYSAERHLYNINIQRQNALNSHKQLLDSVIATESDNEKEIRNAILLELTRAIFENKDTGYLKGVQNPSSTNQIVEVSRTLSK